MWKSILDTVSKGLANDDPKLVEKIFNASVDFDKWVQYYNPHDIASIKEEEKLVVKLLSEDLQDLKMRGTHFQYLYKKTEDDKLRAVWQFLNDTCNAHFWIAVRTKYDLWEYSKIGMRDGFQIVAIPCDHNQGMPEVLKQMLGLE